MDVKHSMLKWSQSLQFSEIFNQKYLQAIIKFEKVLLSKGTELMSKMNISEKVSA